MRFTQILLKARWEKEIGAVGEMTEKFSNLPKSYIKRAMRQVQIDFILAVDETHYLTLWFSFLE